jgi:tRNA A-37 threonylcarbamoyl transferase component Bud32
VIGTLLNRRFRLEEQIGSGGMSTVYRAFDETLERWVAIKLMHREMSDDPAQLERFRREARAVARLSHPHIVTVIDAGEDDGHPFIVFEFVDGETLKDKIRRHGRLPVTEAVAYAIEVGRALACAHSERLVHRDVKPQNVLIDLEGRAKVTDFGIARSLEADGLTATGRVLGTTDYVSPEQALGEPVTPQSDLYSLGICLYEMLTGDVPFRADSQVGVAMKHVRERMPDVQARRPQISAALAAVIERSTAKETRNRYATAEEMVDELEQALAIEVARSGQTTGEATSVLRGLKRETTEFVPGRLLNPRRAVITTLLLAVVAAVVVVVVALNTERGSTGAAAPSGSALADVRIRSADDYDPLGDREEHGSETQNVFDGNPGTLWTTENYSSGGGLGDKAGVGIFVRATSQVAARRLDLISPQPGWRADVYGANEVPEGFPAGWTKLTTRPAAVGENERIPLQTRGREYRYYLIWITALPEGDEAQAAISEISLLK